MTANHSRHSLKKSYGAKSDGSDSLLKKGKRSEKLKKNMVKTTNLFEWTARFLRAKERIRSKSEPKSKELKRKLPTLCHRYYYTPILDNLLHIMDAVTIIAVYCVYCVVLLKFFYEIIIICNNFIDVSNIVHIWIKINRRVGDFLYKKYWVIWTLTGTLYNVQPVIKLSPSIIIINNK